MDYVINKESQKAGAPPGSLILVGKQKLDQVKISVFWYNLESWEEKEISDPEELESWKLKKGVLWVNIEGLHEVKKIESVGKIFSLHPLLVEDLLNTDHRPKTEEYDDYIFSTLKMLWFQPNGEMDSEQVSLVLGKNFVLCFQEMEGDSFDSLRKRIREGKGTIRQKGPAFLLYRLMDIIVDDYYAVVENVGENVEEMELNLFKKKDPRFMFRVQRFKRDLLKLRKTLGPLREAIGMFDKTGSDLIPGKTKNYFKDIHDHTVHLYENIEAYRDSLSSILELYHTNISNKMNGIMKVLTIISTIFIPLTFIAGVYGMNFKYMPELDWHYGYFSALGLMVLIIIGLILYFRKMKWI